MTTPVVTISSRTPDRIKEPYYHLDAFIESAKRQGISPVFLPGKYFGLMSKPRLLLDWIHTNGAAFQHLICCDAWDVALICGTEEIIYNYKGFGFPIVMNAERNCFPLADLADKFPESPTPYKYVNSGFYVGETAAIVSMLETMRDTYGFPDDVHNPDGSWTARNDQGDYSLYFLEHQNIIKLDTTAILAQTLHDADPQEFAYLPDTKRVISLLTKNQPCAIHGNGSGKSWLKRIIGWLGL
jgi:hypothetical protein